MFKIKEIVTEPGKIRAGSNFKFKIRIQQKYTLGELRNVTVKHAQSINVKELGEGID